MLGDPFPCTDTSHLEMAGRESTIFNPTGEAIPGQVATPMDGDGLPDPEPIVLGFCKGASIHRGPWDFGDPAQDEEFRCSDEQWIEFDNFSVLLEAEEWTPPFIGDEEMTADFRGSPTVRIYELFPSFRGEDTRNGFAGHLHAALAECRHRRMLLFVSKAAKSPNFVQHLIQERRQKRELETCELSKKSQLPGPNSESTECLLEVMDHKIRSLNVDCLRISDDSAQMESGPNNVVPEDFEWSPPMGGGDFKDQMAGTSLSDLPLVFHEMPEKLPGDNVVAGDDPDVKVEELLLAADDTGIYLELNEKPCGWVENTSELGEQTAGLMP